MDFRQDGDNVGSGSGNLATGLAMGSMMNKDDNRGSTMVFAAIIIVIVFFIAIIFLALAFKDKGHDRNYNNGTDVAALLTPLIAAKSMDCNNGCKNGELDRFELMQKIEHSEDRARETQTQQEIGSLSKEFANIGFGLSSKIDNVEKEQLKTYATIENQLGMQSMALNQLLQKSNNSDIINGVIQQLTMGAPCYSKC